MREDATSPARARPLAVRNEIEWPTLALIAGVHAGWALVLLHGGALPAWLAALMLAPLLTLHSSLQHEVLHGHPFRDARLNEALVWLPLGLLVPYRRFRDQHLAHHRDPNLTDPYDDPETNFIDPIDWARMGTWRRAVLRANNTMLGRMAFGPFVSMAALYRGDVRAVRAGERGVALAYAHHVAGAVLVLAAVWLSPVPLWAYLAGCWLALSILKIRTFLEHRAGHLPRERSVIVEDRGPLALLFLNNNLHALHHVRPRLAWYKLPAAYAARREAILKRNGGYRYRSYRDVIVRHLLRAKDPVAHPFWSRNNRTTAPEGAPLTSQATTPEAVRP